MYRDINNRGNLRLEQDRYNAAESDLKMALELAGENNIQRGPVVNNLGLLAYNRGIYGEAHEFYTQALHYLGDGIGINNKAAIFNNPPGILHYNNIIILTTGPSNYIIHFRTT